MSERVDRPLLISGMLSSFLGGLAARIFLISLPSLAAGLQTDILATTWALISYQLATIGFSVVFGRLGDVFGPLKIYGIGYTAFTVGSFLCGISQNVLQLIGFRFLQGIGSAMAQSTGRVLVIEAMPKGSEGKASALMTMAFHLGFFIGPPLGGFVIDYVNWRWIFFLLVPVGLAGIALAYTRFTQNRELQSADYSLSVDYIGSGMLVFLMVGLILILDQKSAKLLGVEQRFLLALGFTATVWMFVVHEYRTANPIIYLPLFKIRMFSYSVVSLLAYSTTQGLVGFILPFYLQDILYLSPSFIGAIFLVPALFTISLAYVSGHIADKIGPTTPASAGLVMSIVAYLMGATLKTNSPWLLPTIMLGLMGIGSGFFTSPNQAAILGSASRQHRGLATGVLNATYGLGNLFGISLGGTILTIAFRHYSEMPGSTPDPANPVAFTSSVNTNYMVAIVLGSIALLMSLNRGGAKIQAVAPTAH